MLIGHVSDERYRALAGVWVEFEGGDGASWETRSRASGAVHADLPRGRYRATLRQPGRGGKRLFLTIPDDTPCAFRLLSDALVGYAWPKCVRTGEKAEFRVHAAQAYEIGLCRYGWDKELVQRIGWFDEHAPGASLQLTPHGDYTQTGVAWNKVGWANPSRSQVVTAPARSGLYYFHARTQSGEEFGFPWVVAPDRPRARMAVLLADLTWNAYNHFGGRSNYVNADALPPAPIVSARQDLRRYADPEWNNWKAGSYAPLSFDRPEPANHLSVASHITDTIPGWSANHLAPAEWRLLGWLEREGFAHDVYSETQLHHGLLDLDAYRVLILGPHPEYWTRRMYDRVKDWVFNRHGRLVYLGGNGLNCEVELRDDATMVAHNGQVRNLWPEGIGAESRFALRHESEANLLGVVFDPRGVMTAAPYEILDADHWAFAGTGLRKGSLFGTRSLHERCPGGASGHETDKVSASSPPGVRRLAKGLNPDDGGAELVCFETPSGGAVFSTGSICYVSALPVDDAVSAVTANVLRKFLT
jgi:hypothetical protein